MYLRILVILSIFALCVRDAWSVRVRVSQGWARGEALPPAPRRPRYYSFKGLPYAAPPLRSLRFTAPQPPASWPGTRDATAHGAVCVQPAAYLSASVTGDEDCLYLNVYSPELAPASPLPVMVFIHGGYYRTGSGNSDEYGPDFLMAYGVVLVTINYRLGALGYLSAGTPDVPGNAGMLDQIAALEWVQKNIRSFGGDPGRVTVFGQGAGAASISLHLLLPIAKGLFQRAIVMSGVFYNDYNVPTEPVRRAFALGKQLGLDTNDPNELVAYLQNATPESIITADVQVLTSDVAVQNVFTNFHSTPVIEMKFGNGSGQYLIDSPSCRICEGNINEVDLMIGHTQREGLRSVGLDLENMLQYFPRFKELLVPLKISYYRSPRKVFELADRIYRFYFGNNSIDNSTIKELVDYYTYSHYVYDIHAYLDMLPKTGSRYFYEFAVNSARNFASLPFRSLADGSTHRDDLPYLFDGSRYNATADTDSEAFRYVQLMCTLFTNFAKYGNPTPDNSLGTIWSQYEPGRNYLIIGPNLKTGQIHTEDTKDLTFWKSLYASAGIDF